MRLPSLTKGQEIPRESDLEGHYDLNVGLPQDWGKANATLGEHKQNLACNKTQRKSNDPTEG